MANPISNVKGREIDAIQKVLVLAAVSEAATGVALLMVPSLVGILNYSAAVALYLAYVGFAGGLTGRLLWLAVKPRRDFVGHRHF